MARLDQKVALVTGGSRGIGAAIARRLAGEGASVALTYSASPEKADGIVREIKDEGGRAIAIRADSADVQAVRDAVDETARFFGRLDILVNNEGILVPGLIDDYSIDDFDRMVAVNVRALFVASQAASRHLGEGGRIINIGSMVGDVAAFPGVSVYAMTKAAVAGLTRGLARDFGPRGITVTNVQPGPTHTDMNPSDGAHRSTLIDRIAVGRYGTGEEIAGLVAYLASPESAYVTGASFTIDGGLTA
ncbi:3-oxoacyl-ACP reductase FabG [bacterium]|nr:MAG: 3-oxoacyl-ACP reductase FabG [bacterium]